MNELKETIANEKNSSIDLKNKNVLEKLTKSFLRKIRENDSATKKENLKDLFRKILEKEKF
jgi:hypothetical protein